MRGREVQYIRAQVHKWENPPGKAQTPNPTTYKLSVHGANQSQTIMIIRNYPVRFVV